jgi:hypothetical protein
MIAINNFRQNHHSATDFKKQKTAIAQALPPATSPEGMPALLQGIEYLLRRPENDFQRTDKRLLVDFILSGASGALQQYKSKDPREQRAAIFNADRLRDQLDRALSKYPDLVRMTYQEYGSNRTVLYVDFTKKLLMQIPSHWG